MSSLLLEKDADTIYDEYQDIEKENNLEEAEEEYREDRMEQMISKYGYWDNKMTVESIQVQITDDDLIYEEEDFAKYLGLDYDDYEVMKSNYEIDFDDYSRWLKWKLLMCLWMTEVVKLQ